MKKNELLAQCRFYKGEDSFPGYKKQGTYPKKFDTDHAYVFWQAERIWVKLGGKADNSSMTCLVNCGLSDEHILLARKPAELINIPLALRAIMFEAYCHYKDVDPIVLAKRFLDIVLPEYLG